jgi:hypothetical protein
MGVGSIVMKKVTTTVVVAFLFSSVGAKKGNYSYYCHLLLFGSITMKKAMAFVVVAFFFGSIATKKMMAKNGHLFFKKSF